MEPWTQVVMIVLTVCLYQLLGSALFCCLVPPPPPCPSPPHVHPPPPPPPRGGRGVTGWFQKQPQQCHIAQDCIIMRARC